MSKRLLLVFLFVSALGPADSMPAFYSKVGQLVWIVKSVNATVQSWKELGLQDVHDSGNLTLQERYQGHEQTVTVHAVSGQLGNLGIEMIEPQIGSDAFTDFLSRHGDGIFAIVHQIDRQDVLEREIGRMRHLGVSVLEQVTMPNAAGPVTYIYFDTEPRGKYVLGLMLGPGSAPTGPAGVVSHLAPVIREANSVSDFWASLGFPPLTIDHATPRPDSRYRGKPLLLSFDVGWQRQTPITYEWIIPPMEPPNIYYADFLKRHGEGIQHLGMPVKDLDTAIAHYQRLGYPIWQSGAWGDVGKPHSGRYAYMDTDATGGVVVELIHAYP